jgi:hypothetical protein
MIMSGSFLLGIGNAVDNNFRENKTTHFTSKNVFQEHRAALEIMWKSFLEPSRPQMTIRLYHNTAQAL